jgi:hypothetical protein
VFVAQLDDALRYKPEGGGFDSRWFYWNFLLTNPSDRTLALGSTQPLTEMLRLTTLLSSRRHCH